jgi:signal transduction histidine kinase
VAPLLALREVLLAALPAALTVALLLLATQPAYQALLNGNNGKRFYGYQGLVQDVQTAELASLSPDLSAAQKRAALDRALSSAMNPGQFKALDVVERGGEARLSVVAALLQRNTRASLRAASLEAIELGAQADQRALKLNVEFIGALTSMRKSLICTAVGTGVLSMLLVARGLVLWRVERRRQASREARQREALQLASHELRRPLQSLLLASDLLRHADTPERQQQLLSLIEDSATQLASRADLTRLNDLYLDVTLHVEATDLGSILRPFTSTRVSVSLPTQPLRWPVDPNRLRQIVENLVDNALKYTDGPVDVTLSEVNGAPVIRVRDHGPGLSPEQLHTVFLPYERGPRGLRDGHGLGLPLVRRYARAHGGDVYLTPALGGGLVATLQLGDPPAPLAEPGRDSRF